MSYKLYHGDLQFSSWSFRALLALEHTGVSFDKIRVELDWPVTFVDGSMSDIDFSSISKEPASSCGCEVTQLFKKIDNGCKNADAFRIIPRVPIMQDTNNNLLIFDVLAIADYLERTGEVTNNLWPTDIIEYGIAKSLANHLHADYLTLTEEMSFSKSFRGQIIDLSDEGKSQAKKLLQVVENYVKDKSEYILSDFGIVDIMLVPFAQQYIGWKYNMSNHPTAKDYFSNLLNRPNVKKYITEISLFYNGMNEYEKESTQWIVKHYRFNEQFLLIHNCFSDIVHRFDNPISVEIFQLAYEQGMEIKDIIHFLAQKYQIDTEAIKEDVCEFFNTISPSNDYLYKDKPFQLKPELS